MSVSIICDLLPPFTDIIIPVGGDTMAPPKKSDKDKHIKMSVSFEPRQFDQLMHYCQINERSASWVIRKALSDWFEKHKDDVAP